MSDHDGLREALGSYVLGSLDTADRARVERHLAGCADCRDELSSYAALPGLLSRLTAEDVRADPLAPPVALLPRTLAAVEQERTVGRQRLRRWRGAALGAGVLAAATGLAAVLVLPGVSSDRPGAGTVAPIGRPLTATQPSGAAAGLAELEARPWGTQLRLTLHDLPRQGSFTAWAVDPDGHRSPAATWRATTTGRADVLGACGLAPADLLRLEVVGGDGTRVLTTTT